MKINIYQKGGGFTSSYYNTDKKGKINAGPYLGLNIEEAKELNAWEKSEYNKKKEIEEQQAFNKGITDVTNTAANGIANAAKFVGAFTPMGPVVGGVDAYQAYQDGNTGSALFMAGMEALPYGMKYVGKGLKAGGKKLITSSKKFKNLKETAEKAANETIEAAKSNVALEKITLGEDIKALPIARERQKLIKDMKNNSVTGHPNFDSQLNLEGYDIKNLMENHSDLYSNLTKKFINKQGTSVRGVASGTLEGGASKMNDAYKTTGNKGGDMLGNKGVYVSNSTKGIGVPFTDGEGSIFYVRDKLADMLNSAPKLSNRGKLRKLYEHELTGGPFYKQSPYGNGPNVGQRSYSSLESRDRFDLLNKHDYHSQKLIDNDAKGKWGNNYIPANDELFQLPQATKAMKKAGVSIEEAKSVSGKVDQIVNNITRSENYITMNEDQIRKKLSVLNNIDSHILDAIVKDIKYTLSRKVPTYVSAAAGLAGTGLIIKSLNDSSKHLEKLRSEYNSKSPEERAEEKSAREARAITRKIITTLGDYPKDGSSKEKREWREASREISTHKFGGVLSLTKQFKNEN